MPVKVSSKGQIVIPAAMRKKYGIQPGTEVEILDISGEIIIVPIKKSNWRGMLKFKKPLAEIMKEHKEQEKKKEDKLL